MPCRFCSSTHHPQGCPNANIIDPIHDCAACDSGIYQGEKYVEIDLKKVHTGCILEYLCERTNKELIELLGLEELEE